MTDRATTGDGSPACPFIAFEDERDERSSSPDHRHRCFAELRPAPRAVAHQEAYCLSSAFPVCPTFQDWARREAAKAKAPGQKKAGAPTPVPAPARVSDEESAAPPTPPPSAPDDHDDDLWARPAADEEPVIHRNPPRDWAAPPPWATGGAAGGRSTADDGSGAAARREPGAGLAGSAADRLASGYPVEPQDPAPSAPASEELADLVAPSGRSSSPNPPPINRPPSGRYPTTSAAGRRPTVSASREHPAPPEHDGPSWERARRYEAYPTIKTRAGLPNIPRLGIWAGALAVAAIALFFLPGLFSGDETDGPGPGASASASASPSEATPEPTITPEPSPTAEVYVVKKGDTLNKIAKKFGVTVEQILDANKDTITNPNKIAVGDEIVIPVALPDEIVDPSAANPEASPSS